MFLHSQTVAQKIQDEQLLLALPNVVFVHFQKMIKKMMIVFIGDMLPLFTCTILLTITSVELDTKVKIII